MALSLKSHHYILSEEMRNFYPELMDKKMTCNEIFREFWDLIIESDYDNCMVFLMDNIKVGNFIQVD